MNAPRTPAIALGVLCLGFLAYVATSAPVLPERVAIHFGAGGYPNGWMSRSSHLVFVGALGLGLPLLFTYIGWAVRFIPARFVNIPHREYWLSPERRAESCAYISCRLLWLACLEVLFFAGIQHLTVEANQMSPARLPMDLFLSMVSAFGLAVVLWIIAFVRHFAKTA